MEAHRVPAGAPWRLTVKVMQKQWQLKLRNNPLSEVIREEITEIHMMMPLRLFQVFDFRCFSWKILSNGGDGFYFYDATADCW